MAAVIKAFKFVFKTSGEAKFGKALEKISLFQKQAQKMARVRKKDDTEGVVSSKELTKSYAEMGGKIIALAAAMKVGKDLMMSWARASPFFALQMDRIADATDMFQMIIGDALAPAMEFVADTIWSLYDAYDSLDPKVKEALNVGILLTAVILTLAGAIILLSAGLYPVLATIVILAVLWYIFGDAILWIIDLLMVGLGVAIDFIMIGFQLFLDLIDWLISLFNSPLVQAFMSIIDVIIGPFRDAFNVLVVLFEGFMGIAGSLFDAIKSGVDAVIKWIADRINGITMILGGVAAIIDGIFNLNPDTIMRGVDEMNKGISLLFNGSITVEPLNVKTGDSEATRRLLGGYADGGYVGGKPMPIVAHEGEIILNAAQQKNVASDLTTTNNNQRPVYNFNIKTNAKSGGFLGNDLRRAIMQQGLI